MNSRVSEPVLAAETHCGIQIESVLRIRPLTRKERDDAVMLEPFPSTPNGPETVVLNPMHSSLTSPVAGSSLRNRADSDSTSINVPVEYHFNHVLPDSTNQDKLYYTLGHPIASETMKSLKTAASSRSYGPKKTRSHLLVCMGVANSGKTYTCFGGTSIPKRRAANDGLAPRLIDSLFAQYRTGSSSKGFAIKISMIQVTQPTEGKGIDSNACQVHDLLAFAKSKQAEKSPKRSGNMTVRNMAARFERVVPSPGRKASKAASEDVTVELSAENPKPIYQSARDATQAREMLQNGLSASEKLSKGNQNIHLLVTMQPVVDGSKYGDKIVVLDMAGLEKEKRTTTSRKNNDVSSLNQTACAAVLRCLRVMTHNVNAINGKSSGISTCADDEVSEISFVSQAKDPVKRQLKPVPFRQHKVAMLLSPLFTKSTEVKVSLVLTAYPGHADLQQKRMLLQDVELLHGSSLVKPLTTVVDTGLIKPGRLPNTLQEEQESSNDSESEGDKFRSSPLPEPRVTKTSKHFSGVAAKAVRVEKVNNRTPQQSQRIAARQVKPNAPSAPIAPAFSEVVTPKGVVSDFPGVDIPASLEKHASLRATLPPNHEKDQWISPRAPSSALNEKPERILSNKMAKKEAMTTKPTMQSPLERSGLENCVPTANQGSQGDKFPKPWSKHQQSETNISEMRQSRPESQIADDKQINLLEKKLQQALQEKQALERVCAQLEKENAELKKEAREAGRKVLQTKWTEQDEDEFMASRRMRREAQNLIKAPVQEHLEKVNYVYGIKNQWCMTNKQHFSLQLPNQFQRAPELDLRDKARKEALGEENEADEAPAIRMTQSEDLGCNTATRLSYGAPKPRTSLVSLPQKPVVERPTGLSALKRLAARRTSNV
ncbi:MAG: hypothetical protein SGILL_004631 [Bacillariaceae sp.]